MKIYTFFMCFSFKKRVNTKFYFFVCRCWCKFALSNGIDIFFYALQTKNNILSTHIALSFFRGKFAVQFLQGNLVPQIRECSRHQQESFTEKALLEIMFFYSSLCFQYIRNSFLEYTLYIFVLITFHQNILDPHHQFQVKLGKQIFLFFPTPQLQS